MKTRLLTLCAIVFLLTGCAGTFEGTKGYVKEMGEGNLGLILLSPITMPGLLLYETLAAPFEWDTDGSGKKSSTGSAGSGLDPATLQGIMNFGTSMPRASTPARAPSGLSSGANSSACQELRRMAEQCRTNLQNIGGGSTGQAGAFRECYNNYAGAYNAQCR
jgi:hypothetical protein